MGNPEGKRPLGRPRRRCEDSIRMVLKEVGSGCMDWTNMAQNIDKWRALVNAIMNFRVQKKKKTGNFLTSQKPVSFSRRTLLRGVSKEGRKLRLFYSMSR